MLVKSVVALVAAFATVVSAQTPPITITQPLTDFNWNAGQTYVIAWVNPVVPTIQQIWLATGSSTSLSKMELIAQNVPTAPLSYSWTIDSTIPTGSYSLEFGIAPNLAYAGPFTITNTGAAPANTSSAAGNGTVAASTSAAAAASSSAAASPASSSAAAQTSAAAAPTTSAASSTSVAAPAPTTTTKSGAKMIAPMAALALIPAFFALL